ncbi:MAG: glutathione S-transferase family protein [Pseudomonadota bacterium]
MTDIFDQRAVADTGAGDYGLSGDMKKTQYVLQLLGMAHSADTLKCILAAAEQGMEMNCGSLEESDLSSDEYTSVCYFGIAPSLKEKDFFTAGSRAIIEFINARGLGYSLIPKNAGLAAEQETWVDKACDDDVESALQQLTNEIRGQGGDVAAARSKLEPALNALDTQLSKDKFIVGKNYSLADVHWTAVVHLISVSSAADLIDSHSNIKNWFAGIHDKKSNCGQSVKAATLLPTTEDIKANKLNNVVIDDF